MRYLLYALLIWFLYNLVFRFIIPIYKTTRQVKKKFREMHDHVQKEQMKQEGFNQASNPQNPSPKPRSSDYIDFEEIKWNFLSYIFLFLRLSNPEKEQKTRGFA